jgi:hypothetical protein
MILDFELTAANATDLSIGFELLTQHPGLTAIGDKAYISAPKTAELWKHNHIRLQHCRAETTNVSCHLPSNA